MTLPLIRGQGFSFRGSMKSCNMIVHTVVQLLVHEGNLCQSFCVAIVVSIVSMKWKLCLGISKRIVYLFAYGAALVFEALQVRESLRGKMKS